MAYHKSARKRARQSIKRRARNRHVLSTVRTAVKKARAAVDGDDPAAAQGAVRVAEGQLRRAASKGVIPKTRAGRQISRLHRSVHRASS